MARLDAVVDAVEAAQSVARLRAEAADVEAALVHAAVARFASHV